MLQPRRVPHLLIQHRPRLRCDRRGASHAELARAGPCLAALLGAACSPKALRRGHLRGGRRCSEAATAYEEEIDPLVGEAGSFKQGALQRSLELEQELRALGLDFELLDRPPHCSLLGPALRASKKFLLPRSRRAFDLARTPGRAAVIAADVRRMADEALGERRAWEARCARAREEEEARGEPPRQPLVVVLDGLRSTQNVGSLLLSCDAARVAEVVLCGITPGPPDPAVLRVAGDAAARVPQRYAPSAAEEVEGLRGRGYDVWAMETTSRAVDLAAVKPPQPLALVLGNEHEGVSTGVLSSCERHVRIRMRGMKNSLNVAVAGSIAVFDIARQWCGGS